MVRIVNRLLLFDRWVFVRARWITPCQQLTQMCLGLVIFAVSLRIFGAQQQTVVTGIHIVGLVGTNPLRSDDWRA